MLRESVVSKDSYHSHVKNIQRLKVSRGLSATAELLVLLKEHFSSTLSFIYAISSAATKRTFAFHYYSVSVLHNRRVYNAVD